MDIAAIDKQHKKFFEIYDDLVVMIKDKDTVPHNHIGDVVAELQNYLKIHFQTEERLMQFADCENTENHIKEHEFFIRKIDELALGFKYGNLMLSDELLSFMKKWFLSHILHTDVLYKEKMKAFLEGKAQGKNV